MKQTHSMIQYLLDKEIAKLDSCKQEFFYLYKEDIDIIKNFDGFRILDDGSYWYKGHNIRILEGIK